MAVPKKRKSSSESGKHRSHYHITAPVHLESCPACGEVKARHEVCPSCGSYRGVQVVEKAEEPKE